MRVLALTRVPGRSVLALFTALLVLAAACSNGTSSTTKHVLTIGASSGIPQLNPIIKTFAYEEILYALLWDGLVKQKPDGTPAADLATSWTPASDLRSWTFNLRQGVKFVNGKELTSDDVVQSVNYFIDPKVPAQWAKYNALISGAKAISKYVVEIDLSAPDSSLPVTIEYFQVLDMSTLSTINQKPNGTGPYTVKEFVPDDHLYLVPNPKYWGPKPKLDELDIVKTADPTAAVTALKTGSIQALWGPPQTAVADLASDSNIKVLEPQAPAQLHELEFDDSSFPFNDVRARQAFSYATDRDTILKTAYGGIGVTSPQNDYLSTKNVAYDGSLPKYDYNLDKAKQLFDAVGVKHLTWWTIAGAYPQWVTEGQIIQGDLAKIGITMDIQTNEISTWAAKFYPAHKKYPGVIIPNVLPGGAWPLSMSFIYGGASSLNWHDAGFDQAYVSAQGTVDTSAQKGFVSQLQRIQDEQVPSVVPLHSVDPVLVRSNVSGLWVGNDGRAHLEDAGVS